MSPPSSPEFPPLPQVGKDPLPPGVVKLPKPYLNPKIKGSIWPMADGQWALGSLMICEKLVKDAKIPGDVITSWKDAHGEDYYLRPRPATLPLVIPEYDPANRPIIPRRWSSAIFEVGRHIWVKVMYTPKGYARTEGYTINLIREQAPSVPVPENIHYWIDEEWERSFMIMRRIPGILLYDAWPKLSGDDRHQMVKELTAHIKAVSEITSPYFQRVDGTPERSRMFLLHENYEQRNSGIPIPDLHLPGPFSVEEFRAAVRQTCDGIELPEMDPPVFHLCHGDFHGGNILVSGYDEPKEEGKSHVHVIAIIDWELAAFYPRFWITYDLPKSLAACGPKSSLRYKLEYSLEQEGFTSIYTIEDWLDRFLPGRVRFIARQNEEREAAETADEGQR